MLPKLIDINTIFELDVKLNERFKDIPFGNSQFQVENFIINAQLTPARAYRSIGLNLSKCLQALKVAYFGYQRNLIDIAELEDKVGSVASNKYEKQRNELALEEKRSGEAHLVKLVEDAAKEASFYVKILDKFPKYTKEQFEREESEHFKKKLKLQSHGITGALESLFCMRELDSDSMQKIGHQIFYDPYFKLVTEMLESTKLTEEKK